MPNGHGGARKNAGRKPRPLAERIASQNKNSRPLKKVEFAGEPSAASADSRTPPDFLLYKNRNVEGVPLPVEIYAETVDYLEPSGCLPLIPKALISDYVMAKYYLYCAQDFLAKPEAHIVIKTDTKIGGNSKEYPQYKVSEFTESVIKLHKHAAACWQPIWDIVSRNSERLIDNPEEDMIGYFITGRMRKGT